MLLEPFLASPNQRRRCPRSWVDWLQLHFCSAPFATREDDDDDEEEEDDDEDVGFDVSSRRCSNDKEAVSAGIEK